MKIRIGGRRHFHDDHDIHEIETSPGNAKFHIFIVFFLSFFVAALIFALVVVINQTIPGELSYSYVETIEPGKAIYDIEIIAKDDDYKSPQRFEVNIEGSNGATYSKTVTAYKTLQSDEDYYVYKFQVVIDSSSGNTAWMYADGVADVFLVDDEGDLNEASEVLKPIEMLPAFIIIPIFLIVIGVIMGINIKSAVKSIKNAKAEKNEKLSNASTLTRKRAEEEMLQRQTHSGDYVECPYCHLQNKIGDGKCQGCGAPIRK